MRKAIEKQLKIGQSDIPSIKIDLDCRDEVPQLLLGIQTLYANDEAREKLFSIIQKMIPPAIDPNNGRKGMDLWEIFILGTLRLNCNWDYDKLQDFANNHKKLREFLGHTGIDFEKEYKLQTIKDNVKLFTPEILDEINQIVVKLGHREIQKEESKKLKARCDSFVVETDVHFPTDINLLLDAIRKVLFLIGKLFDDLGISEWRQYRHIFKKIKKQFNSINRMKHSTSRNETKKAERKQQIVEAHRQFIDMIEIYVNRAKKSLEIIDGMGIVQVASAMLIENFISHAERQIDQIRRRVINDETIPHNEKVFSIFEEHTEWINKGKAGVGQELGLGVCVLEDQHGFILHHHVMEQQKDIDIAVSMVAEAKRKFPGLSVCSFDKGFYSPKNRTDLSDMLEFVVLPKKGKLSENDKRIEYSDEFIESRKQHAAVESAINALENHGLDRCPDHGIIGFKRYVGLAVLARNIQKLGAVMRKKELKKFQRKRRAA